MHLKGLRCNFLTEADVLKLNLANVQTTDQLITFADLNSLSESTKIPLKNLQLLRKFIIGQYAPFPQPAHSFFDRLVRKFFFIETGSSSIDELISNGFYSSEISEISGPSSSGKTQFCFNLVANFAVKPHSHGSVLYVDSNRGFCIERLRELVTTKLPASQSNEDATLKRIMESIRKVECTSPFDLLDILFSLRKAPNQKLVNNRDDLPMPSLLVIDSLSALFRGLFKPGYSIDAAYYLVSISNQLKYLASDTNMAIVVVTNSGEIGASNRVMNLFNLPNWTSVANLVVSLGVEESESETGMVTKRRKLEVVKLNRPFYNDIYKAKNFSYFSIQSSGIL